MHGTSSMPQQHNSHTLVPQSFPFCLQFQLYMPVECDLCCLLRLPQQVVFWYTVEFGSKNEVIFGEAIARMSPDLGFNTVPALQCVPGQAELHMYIVA